MKSLPGGGLSARAVWFWRWLLRCIERESKLIPLISRYAYAENHDHVVLVTAKDIAGGA